MAVEID